MIDDNYRPWLIEINSSPACDYSTPITESFVKRVLPDLLKVVLDTKKDKRDGRAILPSDTGGWSQIYSGTKLPKVVANYGSDLSLKGEKVIIQKHTNTYRPQESIKKSKPRTKEKIPDGLIFDDSDLSSCDDHNELRSASKVHQDYQFKSDSEKILQTNKDARPGETENVKSMAPPARSNNNSKKNWGYLPLKTITLNMNLHS